MRNLVAFDYAVIRVVPRVEREEFINVGAIVFCRVRRYLDSRVEMNEDRLAALLLGIDVAEVRRHLELIPLVCRGGSQAGAIGRLNVAERFHWLVAARSTVIQTSAVHSGLCEDPAEELEHLLRTMVRVPDAPAATVRYP